MNEIKEMFDRLKTIPIKNLPIADLEHGESYEWNSFGSNHLVLEYSWEDELYHALRSFIRIDWYRDKELVNIYAKTFNNDLYVDCPNRYMELSYCFSSRACNCLFWDSQGRAWPINPDEFGGQIENIIQEKYDFGIAYM